MLRGFSDIWTDRITNSAGKYFLVPDPVVVKVKSSRQSAATSKSVSVSPPNSDLHACLGVTKIIAGTGSDCDCGVKFAWPQARDQVPCHCMVSGHPILCYTCWVPPGPGANRSEKQKLVISGWFTISPLCDVTPLTLIHENINNTSQSDSVTTYTTLSRKISPGSITRICGVSRFISNTKLNNEKQMEKASRPSVLQMPCK